jgi:hypothetical protein
LDYLACNLNDEKPIEFLPQFPPPKEKKIFSRENESFDLDAGNMAQKIQKI